MQGLTIVFVFVFLPLISLAALATADLPHHYTENWDEKVGLWVSRNAKTGPSGRGHVMRANAWKLVSAGMDGVLDKVQAGRVLRGLRKAQIKDGAMRGNFWWAWEDGRATDSNSAFFTGLALLILRMEFGDKLSAEDCGTLDEMLSELRVWNRRETNPLNESKLRYPNKCLGELTCMWLLAELEDEIPPHTEKTLAKGLAYYRDKDWGWGEHLSDLYGKICQYELVALLCYGKRLPQELRASVASLLGELLAIDAIYAGGPRVPTIRCYEMDRSPRTPSRSSAVFQPYRTLMTPWDGQGGPTGMRIMACLAYRHGLHKRLPAPAPSPRQVTIACHGQADALAVVHPRWRIGAMSRYPLSVDVNVKTHGLHWQTMPVAFWHVAGDWGYLQWMTREDGVTRALPALGRHERPSCVLSNKDPKARVGQTFGRRHGEEFLVLRRMPAVAEGWPWLIDRFRLVDATTAKPKTDTVNGWQRCVLRYDKEVLTLAFRPLAGKAQVKLRQGNDRELLWEARFGLRRKRQERLAGLWFLAVGDDPATPPACDADDTRAEITFPDGAKAELRIWGKQPWKKIR